MATLLMLQLISSALLCLFPIRLHAQVSILGWFRSSSPRMPQSDYGAAVGYYGFDAFILGGVNKPKQMTRYESWNGRNGKYINRGTSKLKRQTFGTSQYYVQLNHTLYIIDPLDSRINLYDLENDVFTTNWFGIKVPEFVGSQSCITGTDRYLYIVGGIGQDLFALNSVYSLDVWRFQWNTDPLPTLNHARRRHACYALQQQQTLFAIGGQGDIMTLDSVEYIKTKNIDSNVWRFIPSNADLGSMARLAMPSLDIRTVKVGQWIYIIGGYDAQVFDSAYLSPLEGQRHFIVLCCMYTLMPRYLNRGITSI